MCGAKGYGFLARFRKRAALSHPIFLEVHPLILGARELQTIILHVQLVLVNDTLVIIEHDNTITRFYSVSIEL